MVRPKQHSQKQPKKRALGPVHWLVILTVIGIGALAIIFRESWLTKSVQQDSGFNIPFKTAQEDAQVPRNLQNNISRFFAGIRSSDTPMEETLSPYVILLEQTDIQLPDILAHLRTEVADAGLSPLPKRWTGSRDEHWFMPDETIKNRLEQIAVAEGMTFIWWLRQDYVVKSPFSVDANFVDLVNEVAITVNDDYQGSVEAFICLPHRAIIIIESQAIPPLPKECWQAAKLHQEDAVIKREGLPNLRIKE